MPYKRKIENKRIEMKFSGNQKEVNKHYWIAENRDEGLF